MNRLEIRQLFRLNKAYGYETQLPPHQQGHHNHSTFVLEDLQIDGIEQYFPIVFLSPSHRFHHDGWRFSDEHNSSDPYEFEIVVRVHRVHVKT